MSNNEIDIHMSDLDEETKRILAEVDTAAETADSSKDNKKKEVKKSDIEWETNTTESPDDEW